MSRSAWRTIVCRIWNIRHKRGGDMEFSKKILLRSWRVALTLTALAVVFPMVGLSIEGICVALPLSWGEVALVHGFYLWKAKNENRHKYAMKYVDKYAQKYDVETALRLAEIVLRE